ncbi:MAG: LAS superfamily LD-carboxypeptidase LdcB [Halieaceae bacterium]|jgi:LAS superfamily LD-carboxypeptidase LdcB
MPECTDCPLTLAQLTGKDESHLVVDATGLRLFPECAQALIRLQECASVEGFDLRVASGYRSFSRQRDIWNAKACGDRPVHDDMGCEITIEELGEIERLWAILRYSALPGASRHHWGTDIDVYDAAAVSADYRVKLEPVEVNPGGVFEAMHNWLDAQIAAGDSFGFFRPYADDRGGVAPERWHLSYAPISQSCAKVITPGKILDSLLDYDLALAETVSAQIQTIYTRFIHLS